MIYDSILGTIGRTPVVRINRLAPKGIDMFVKVEAFNPMSSVKDRLAIAIIEDAERRGALQAGANGHRGDLGQHGDCTGHGVRGQGLPDGGGNGRVFFC